MAALNRLHILVLAMLAAFAVAGARAATHAAEPVTPETLDAVARALGFLETSPGDNSFLIAVVHAGGPGDEAAAEQISGRLSGRPGPKRSRLVARSYSIDALLQSTDKIDAVLLVPGRAARSDAVSEFVRARRVLSISSDSDCLEVHCCVLMVKSGRNVEIVLDTGLANDVGARFSSVFTMMVTRQ